MSILNLDRTDEPDIVKAKPATPHLLDPSQISGLGEFKATTEKLGSDEEVKIFWKKVKEEAFGDDQTETEKAFLVVRKNTLEVRSDRKLSQLLCEKYESVMESRYFGRGGVEIVNSGQLTNSELEDLIRLSYNLT